MANCRAATSEVPPGHSSGADRASGRARWRAQLSPERNRMLRVVMRLHGILLPRSVVRDPDPIRDPLAPESTIRRIWICQIPDRASRSGAYHSGFGLRPDTRQATPAAPPPPRIFRMPSGSPSRTQRRGHGDEWNQIGVHRRPSGADLAHRGIPDRVRHTERKQRRIDDDQSTSRWPRGPRPLCGCAEGPKGTYSSVPIAIDNPVTANGECRCISVRDPSV